MGLNSTGYEIVKTLHILGAIVGFGGVMLNGLYAVAMKRKRGPEAAFMGQTVFEVSGIAQYFIYGVFILGFALLGMSDDAWKFSQTWVWLSVLLYVVGVGLSHGLLKPNTKRMNELMSELAMAGPPAHGTPSGPPPQAVELDERGKRQMTVSLVLNLIVVVVTYLMVAKPGR